MEPLSTHNQLVSRITISQKNMAICSASFAMQRGYNCHWTHQMYDEEQPDEPLMEKLLDHKKSCSFSVVDNKSYLYFQQQHGLFIAWAVCQLQIVACAMIFTARCTTVQSAVLLSLVVCPSVCPSVRL